MITYTEKKSLFYKMFVTNPEGALLLEMINKHCHYGTNLFRDNERRQTFALGQNEVAVWIQDMIEDHKKEMKGRE